MAKERIPTRLKPSILDRLIDPDCGGGGANFGYTVEQMVAAVTRDLEDLLNTRVSTLLITENGREFALDSRFPQAANSIVTYGLPDLASLKAISGKQREEIGQMIEETIKKFEPRLTDVKAIVLSGLDPKDRRIHFRVDSRLNMDPAPELVFDTMLELATGHYSVDVTER
jgi:type VI secretion system protein ImpF